LNPISITVTGHLGDNPRRFSTHDGAAGVELRLAPDIRDHSGDSITVPVTVVVFGALARHVAESIGEGDRVTVLADDFTATAWTAEVDGETVARGQVVLRARDISASMLWGNLRTGAAARQALRAAAANGQPTSLPAHEQAEARILAGLITTRATAETAGAATAYKARP
jgi:single-stranded DNA-binding protein